MVLCPITGLRKMPKKCCELLDRSSIWLHPTLIHPLATVAKCSWYVQSSCPYYIIRTNSIICEYTIYTSTNTVLQSLYQDDYKKINEFVCPATFKNQETNQHTTQKLQKSRARTATALLGCAAGVRAILIKPIR